VIPVFYSHAFIGLPKLLCIIPKTTPSCNYGKKVEESIISSVGQDSCASFNFAFLLVEAKTLSIPSVLRWHWHFYLNKINRKHNYFMPFES